MLACVRKKNTQYFLYIAKAGKNINLKRVSLQQTGNWLKCILFIIHNIFIYNTKTT